MHRKLFSGAHWHLSYESGHIIGYLKAYHFNSNYSTLFQNKVVKYVAIWQHRTTEGCQVTMHLYSKKILFCIVEGKKTVSALIETKMDICHSTCEK